MNLGLLDIVVLGAYFIAILAVGLWFGRGERSTHDFFLGGKRQHWLPVGLSIIATEVSALTFLIVPGRSYESDFWYLQTYVGSFIGRVLIAYLLLPAFYGGSVTTVYEYLGQRFGPWMRTAKCPKQRWSVRIELSGPPVTSISGIEGYRARNGRPGINARHAAARSKFARCHIVPVYCEKLV